MLFISNNRKFLHLEISIVALAMILFFHSGTLSKPLNNKYQYTITMLSVRSLWLNNNLQKVVVVRTIKDQLFYFNHDDPTRTVKSTILRDIDRKKIRPDRFEGSLINLDSSHVQLLINKNRITMHKLSSYEIISERHELGQILTIPVKNVKSITVLKSGNASKGAVVGAGVGALLSATLTIFDDHIQGDTGNQIRNVQNNIPGITCSNHLTRGQFFLSSCLVTVPVCASIGAMTGSGKKVLDHFIVYGTLNNYNKVKGGLSHYMKIRNRKN